MTGEGGVLPLGRKRAQNPGGSGPGAGNAKRGPELANQPGPGRL